MKNIFLITILLTLSSCMVSTKVFDATVSDLQGQIDSKLPKVEFELKEQLMKQVVIDLYDTVDSLKVKRDTVQ